MSDFLEQKRKEISERMRELEPLIEEYRQLEAAAGALAGVVPAAAAKARATATRRPAPARPRGASGAAAV
ncbi:MAG TPA: hypothetical protein VFR49_01430, partial [Solirubrobacteraceae bacterium]|nr:hypothetical protein [Solirubrobacteraceae bacterium]